MNHSLYSADRTTHLKIVAVALIAGIATVGLGILSRIDSGAAHVQTSGVIKAGKPVVMTSYDASISC